MSRGKLRVQDEKIIQRNYRYLKRELEARDLLDDLYENEVITNEEKVRIGHRKTTSDRNEDLLQTLLHSGPGNSFSFFLSSLEEKYEHVYVKLKKKGGARQRTTETTDENEFLRGKENNDFDDILNHKNDEIQRLKSESADALSKLIEKCDENKQIQDRLEISESNFMRQSELLRLLTRPQANRKQKKLLEIGPIIAEGWIKFLGVKNLPCIKDRARR